MSYGTPSRTEKLVLGLTLGNDMAKAHASALDVLLEGGTPHTNDGDTLKVSYRFEIGYYGNTVAKLTAVNEMLAAGVAMTGSLEELVHGRCLIREVLYQLDDLIQREARR
jgi:hypothetical protein